MGQRPLITDTTSAAQLQYAERKVKDRQKRFESCLRAVANTPEGRLVLATFIERAGVDRVAYENSGSRVYFLDGQRSIGVLIRESLKDADYGLYELMERERRSRETADNRETAAAHDQAADTGGEDDG